MAAPTVVAATALSASASGITAALPTGYTAVNGDIQCLLFTSAAGAGLPTITTTAAGGGWIVGYNAQPVASGNYVTLIYRTITGSSTFAASPVSLGASSRLAVLRYIVSAGAILGAVGVGGSATASTTNTAPSINTGAADSLLQCMNSTTLTSGATTATMSTPTGMSPSYFATPTAAGDYLTRFSFETRPTQGSTGTRVATSSLSGAWRALSIEWLAPVAAISTLTDDFSGTLAAKWPSAAGTVISGGAAVMTPTTVNVEATFNTGGTRYSLLGSAIYGKLTFTPGTGRTAAFRFSTSSGGRIDFGVQGANVIAYSSNVGFLTSSDYAALGSPQWFRISESAGTVTFATSPDGVTWTTFGTTPTPAFMLPAGFNVGPYAAFDGTGTTFSAAIDNVNVAPAISIPVDIAGATASATGAAGGGAPAGRALVAGTGAAGTASASPGTVTSRVAIAGTAPAMTASAAGGSIAARTALAGATASATAAAASGAVTGAAAVAGTSPSVSAAAEPGVVSTVQGTLIVGATASATASGTGGSIAARTLISGVASALTAIGSIGAAAGRAAVIGLAASVVAASSGGVVAGRADTGGATASVAASGSPGSVLIGSPSVDISGATASVTATVSPAGWLDDIKVVAGAVVNIYNPNATPFVPTVSGYTYTAGDLQLVFYNRANSGTFLPPAGEGWVAVYADVLLASQRLGVYWRPLAGGDGSTAWAASTADSVAVGQAILRGADPGSPIAASATNPNATNTFTITAPSVSAPEPRDILLTWHGFNATSPLNNAFDPPGMTRIGFIPGKNVAGSVNNWGGGLFRENRQPAGPTGTRDMGLDTSSAFGRSASLLIRRLLPPSPAEVVGSTASATLAGSAGSPTGRSAAAGAAAAATASASPGAIAARATLAGATASGLASASPGAVSAWVAVLGATGALSASAQGGSLVVGQTIPGSTAFVLASGVAGGPAVQETVAGATASGSASADPGSVVSTVHVPVTVVGATGAVSAAAIPGVVLTSASVLGPTAAVTAQASAGSLSARALITGATARVLARASVGTPGVIALALELRAWITGPGLSASLGGSGPTASIDPPAGPVGSVGDDGLTASIDPPAGLHARLVIPEEF